MTYSCKVTIVVLCILSSLVSSCSDRDKDIQGKSVIDNHTDWQIKPSFKFDALCFLNTLTGDSFYVSYYQDEFNKFKPKLTATASMALANLKRIIKDENRGIISAFLCLFFSATEDTTLDDMLKTIENSNITEKNLKQTPYYSQEGWKQFESVKEDLKKIFLFLKDINFELYWKDNVLPKTNQKIATIAKDLPKYNVIYEVESHLGFKLPSNTITVYMLYYSQPHGIKITGTRFLTDVAWPFEIVVRNGIHEMMHPPFDLKNDVDLKNTLWVFKEDAFLMDKILNHNPAFGYNSFEGFIEEDCVQALDQIISEKLNVAKDAKRRWKENDDGMHVFSVALYKLMKEENYNQRQEKFRDFLIRMIRSGKLYQGKIKTIYNDFYSTDS